MLFRSQAWDNVQFDAGSSSITIDCGAAVAIDYFSIAAHELFTSNTDNIVLKVSSVSNFATSVTLATINNVSSGVYDGSYATTRNAAVYTQFELGRGGNFIFGNELLSNWMVASFSPPNLYNWVHIAVVADGSWIKGYLNGVQQFDIAHPNWPSMMSFLQFGKNGDGQYNGNGTLDEVLLYSEALWTADFTPPTTPFSC